MKKKTSADVAIEEFTIQGEAPLLMHNGDMADPLSEFSKDLKVLTSKQKKTDEIHEQIARLEWLGGLYTNGDGRVVIPSKLIDAALIGGAKKNKLGVKFKASVGCTEESFLLQYDGPKDPEKLYECAAFRDRRGVVVQRSRCFRTRPIFRSWRLTFSLQYNTKELNRENIVEAIVAAGKLVGIGDFRPQYGRFDLVA